DAAEACGLHFLVMEYVDGIDCGQLIHEAGPLPVVVASEYVRQVALGLHYAHERGFIHRDIKPSNLLLCRTDRLAQPASWSAQPPRLVKILDLGLARVQAAGRQRLSEPEAEDGHPITLTDDGGIEGTPDYMAPEAAQDGLACDGRSDLYSLGG